MDGTEAKQKNVEDRWYRTTNLSKALSVGYIGEVVIRPKLLVNAMREARRQGLLPVIRMYYCGTPDEYLEKKLGLVKGVVTIGHSVN